MSEERPPYPPPDHVLLDFDPEPYADYEESRTRQLLTENPESFRSQLVAASWFDWWIERLENPRKDGVHEHWRDSDYGKGYVRALQEVVAYLREGYLLPGGRLYDEMFATSSDPIDPPTPAERLRELLGEQTDEPGDDERSD